ncbi:hypothetical protein GCM10017712_12920 [Curtobacterium citreum]
MIAYWPNSECRPATRTVPAATAPIGVPIPGVKSSPWWALEQVAHGAIRYPNPELIGTGPGNGHCTSPPPVDAPTAGIPDEPADVAGAGAGAETVKLSRVRFGSSAAAATVSVCAGAAVASGIPGVAATAVGPGRAADANSTTAAAAAVAAAADGTGRARPADVATGAGGVTVRRGVLRPPVPAVTRLRVTGRERVSRRSAARASRRVSGAKGRSELAGVGAGVFTRRKVFR